MTISAGWPATNKFSSGRGTHRVSTVSQDTHRHREKEIQMFHSDHIPPSLVTQAELADRIAMLPNP